MHHIETQTSEIKMKTSEMTIKEAKEMVDATGLLYTIEEYNRLVCEVWLDGYPDDGIDYIAMRTE